MTDKLQNYFPDLESSLVADFLALFELKVENNLHRKNKEYLFLQQAASMEVRLKYQKIFLQNNPRSNKYNYITPDFVYEYDLNKQIVIECDGNHHNWSSFQYKDDMRDLDFINKGIHVIRFHNRVIEYNARLCVMVVLKEVSRLRDSEDYKPSRICIYKESLLEEYLVS